MPAPRYLHRLFPILATILVAAILVIPGCSKADNSSSNSSGNLPNDSPSSASAQDAGQALPFIVTEFNIKEILSCGLPVILNFGDNSQDSQETLSALRELYDILHDYVRIVSVDLAEKPDAKEGYPVQVIPSQFFYGDSGKPIPLPIGIGVLMSAFTSLETEEPMFTIHEGPMTLNEFLVILDHIGVIELQ
ncbi:MAG: hypothetical protein FWF83_00710 [Clostridiales bacterium]|nr:hypothetical protein [Clostridiales bacterium]